ncbi:MAG TPA: radical SAM protein [Candidatus Methanoperedens sp.]|nr:radical SAM protein [Candidatus Methanoperedens sp.]
MIDAGAPENQGRLARLQRRLREAGIPAAGVIEPTRRCNLNCVHCYLGGERAQPADGCGELDTAAWLALIDGMAAAGCLELCFSGGEPLLRPDFSALYARARRAGIAVTLFTNATLAHAGHAALLRELPAAAIEVSIYGGTATTHDRVTGVPGSFRDALAGVALLAGSGAPLTVKTVLLAANLAEFDLMRRLAADLGARWRFDAVIIPRLDGDRAPLALRVPPAAAARLDIADAARASEWRNCYEAGRDALPSRRLFPCGAGLTNFHVDPRGTLRPCLMARRPAVDLRSARFAAAWRGLAADVSLLEAPADSRCSACDRRNICGYCPMLLERGGSAHPSAYLCELGDRRRELLYTP